MRILLLTENPVLALGLEAALRQTGHTLLLCSTVAQLREQVVASSRALEPPKVLVLDQAHVGLAVLNDLKEEMTHIHTVLWVDEIPVEFGYQSLDNRVCDSGGHHRPKWKPLCPLARVCSVQLPA